MTTYYGQWQPSVDEVIHVNYFPDKTSGFFIECGAANGLYESSCLFFDKLGWHGINIEPAPDLFEQLKINRPNNTNILGCLSNKTGYDYFTLATHPQGHVSGGAMRYIPKLRSYVQSAGYKFQQIMSSVYTYDSIINGYGMPQVDLFVLDVEGHEIEVIEGMNKHLPKVMAAEYTVSGLEKITTALQAKGYRFDFISFNNAYYSIGMPEKVWFGKTEKWNW